MTLLRRAIAADEAQETRVFLLMAAFGVLVAAIYWFVSYEPAGTVLLGGFGVATGVIGARLAADPTSKRLRKRGAAGRGPVGAPTSPEVDASGAGTGGVERPFLDESGRLPDTTIAPFAVGLGVALAATGLVFGLAPVVVGLLPLGWGAWTWLTAARDELSATTGDDQRA